MNDVSGLMTAAPQSVTLKMTLRRAAAFAQQRSHRYVTLEHLLLALSEDADALQLLRSVNPDIEPLRSRAADVVNRFLNTLYTPGGATELRPSYKLERILQIAATGAAKTFREVDGAFVVCALLGEADSVAAGLLRQHGLNEHQATGWVQANRNQTRHGQGVTTQNNRRHGFRLEDRLATASEPRADARHERPPHSPRQPSRREGKLSAALKSVKPDATPQEAPQPSSKPAAARALTVKKPGGKFLDGVPKRFRVGETQQIDVRISREEAAALFTVPRPSATEPQDAIITRAVTVVLKAPDGGFTVETIAPETQWLFDRPSFLETERFGRWRWTVTATEPGKRTLKLIVKARSVDDTGMVGDMVTPDQVVEVRTGANHRRRLQKLLLWMFLIVTGGVLAETALRFGPHLLR